MNRSIATALLQDAYAQVVDNMVFRLLVWMLIVLVLPTFIIQLGPEGVRILFVFEYRWDELVSTFGVLSSIAPDENTHIQVIEFVQSAVSDYLAGMVGVLLCVTATAFFVPRMLEKGAADTVFSKPVSRLVLMLSRYAAGLIFVSVLAAGLIGGMHLGFGLVSGYSMKGFLWSIPMLIYTFAVMHAVSVLVGVVTRSSVATILLVVIFFFTNSCVHNAWETKQVLTDQISDDLGAGLEGKQLPTVLRWLGGSLDTAHYALPKTRDARRVVKLMRAQVERGPDELRDAETSLVVAAAPEGFAREPRSSLGRSGVLWLAPEPGGGEARITLERRNAGDFESRLAETRALQSELQALPEVADIASVKGPLAGRSGHGLRWRETRAGAERRRERWFFESGPWLFLLDVDADAAWAARQGLDAHLNAFTAGFSFEGDQARVDSFNPLAIYTSRFGWRAALPYNAWVSIGSTLLFSLLALAVGWGRLARIDF